MKHLRDKKVLINRYANIEEIPAFKQSNCETLSLNDKIALIVDYLIKRGNAKPRKVETLSNTINSICGRTLNKKQLEDLNRTDNGYRLSQHLQHVYHLDDQLFNDGYLEMGILLRNVTTLPLVRLMRDELYVLAAEVIKAQEDNLRRLNKDSENVLDYLRDTEYKLLSANKMVAEVYSQ